MVGASVFAGSVGVVGVGSKFGTVVGVGAVAGEDWVVGTDVVVG